MLRTRVKPAKLALYKMHHAMVWHCVEEGLRKIAGLTRLQIWAPAAGGPDENCLNMLIETPAGVELAEVTGEGSPYWNSHADVPKWELLMRSFFEAGAWVEMEQIYNLNPSSNVTGAALEQLKADIAAAEAAAGQ